MITDPLAQALLAVLFVGTTVFFMVTALRGSGTAARIGDAIHVLMSVAMFAMIWEWGMALPALPQIVLFLAATAWFAVLALLPNPPSAHSATAGGVRWMWANHAVMMLAMAWMLWAMLEAMSGGDHAGHTAGHAPASTLALITGLPLVVLLLAALAVQIGDLLSGLGRQRGTRDRAHRARDAANALMGIGMIAMMLPLLAA